MTFKYRVLTANCGNDVIGAEASARIASQLKQDQADFYVINAQEISFAKTLQQLQEAVGEKYTVVQTKPMVTHTKFATQIHQKIGIVTFIIHKKELKVDLQDSQKVRRSNSRRDGGAYNKGGLVSNFEISRDNQKFKIHSISGHLDSNNPAKRTRDWHNINKAMEKEVTGWEELVAASPHLRLSGYDANTRNKISPQKGVTNLWMQQGAIAPEIL